MMDTILVLTDNEVGVDFWTKRSLLHIELVKLESFFFDP